MASYVFHPSTGFVFFQELPKSDVISKCIFQPLPSVLEPQSNLPGDFSEEDLALGDAIRIIGYKVDKPEVRLTDEVVLTLAWEPMIVWAIAGFPFRCCAGRGRPLIARVRVSRFYSRATRLQVEPARQPGTFR